MRLARRRGARRDEQPSAGRGAATLAALREHLQARQVHRPDASLRARAAGVARLRAGQVQAGRRRARPRRLRQGGRSVHLREAWLRRDGLRTHHRPVRHAARPAGALGRARRPHQRHSGLGGAAPAGGRRRARSEEHTSALQSLLRIPYAGSYQDPPVVTPPLPTLPASDLFGPARCKPAVAGHDLGEFAKAGEAFTYEKHGFVATAYELTTDQYGTQLDPPAHWDELGATISDIPASVALRPLVVVDVHEKSTADPGYQATADDVKAWEAEHGPVPEGSVVMFRSDWYKIGRAHV